MYMHMCAMVFFLVHQSNYNDLLGGKNLTIRVIILFSLEGNLTPLSWQNVMKLLVIGCAPRRDQGKERNFAQY